jgi:hypothetical protein
MCAPMLAVNCNIFLCDDGDCGDTCAVVEGAPPAPAVRWISAHLLTARRSALRQVVTKSSLRLIWALSMATSSRLVNREPL